MKQSQKRYFNHSACDCRDCARSEFAYGRYAALVAALLIGSFAALLVIAKLFPSTQIVK